MTSAGSDDNRGQVPGRGRPRLAAAQAATARGWPVFPIHPYAKRPAIRDWEHQASLDPNMLTVWWHVAPYNVGIPCGPAGLVVIDLDDGHGQEPPARWARHRVTGGRDVFELLAVEHSEAVTDTYTVATPSGGEHRYYAAPSGLVLRNTVGVLGWRIDTRAAGGYVVAAGSARRINGHTRLYTVTNPGPVAPLPDWIATALTRRPTVLGPAAPWLSPSGARLDAWVTAAVTGEASRVAAATPGHRNTALFTAACRLGELVGAGVLDEHDATTALQRAAAAHHGIDGFTPTEADRAIANGLARGRLHPRPIRTGPDQNPRVDHHGD